MKFYQWLFITLTFVLTSCQGEKKTQKSNGDWFQGTIKVGHLVALDMAPLFIAKEANFFKEEGLEVETIFFANPGDNNAALAGGKIQFSTNPFTLPYFGANSGLPMRIISSAGGIGVIEVIIQGSVQVEGVQQFIDYIKNNSHQKLKIGVLKGDTLEMIIYKLLYDNGLSYDDVEMVWYNDLLAMVQSFQTKQIDVLSHIKPYTTDMIVNYGAKRISDNSEVWGYATPNCTVAVMESFSEKYPETIKAYLRALERGFEMIIKTPEKAVNLLQGGNYYKVDDQVLLYAFKNQPQEVILRPDIDGMMTAINDMVEANYIEQPKKNIVLTKFLDELGEE